MPEITVLSINLHGAKDGWFRGRRDRLSAQIADARPDVVLCQEAATWAFQARFVARSLSRLTNRPWHSYSAAKPGWKGLLEGCSILTPLPVREPARLPFRNDARVAQRLSIIRDRRLLDMYNTHLSHGGDAGHLRLAQAELLQKWMARGRNPAVLGGDLNSQPGSRSLTLLGQLLRSAHVAANGSEPERTAPVDLAKPGYVLDYLLVSAEVDVLSCSVVGNIPDPTGRYPTDHFGLVARLRWD